MGKDAKKKVGKGATAPGDRKKKDGQGFVTQGEHSPATASSLARLYVYTRV